MSNKTTKNGGRKMNQTHRQKYINSQQAAEARRKAKRQAAAGILPLWKAAAIIDAAMQQGATFEEAHAALMDILAAQGLKLRADIRG